MELKVRILEDMKKAMKEGPPIRKEALRFLQAAIKNKEIDMRPQPIGDKEVLDVVKKMLNQRKDSIEQFRSAQRLDLVQKEEEELGILQSYLPEQLSRGEVELLVKATVEELQATSIKDMGAVMKAMVQKTQGGADNKLMSELIKAALSGS